MVVLRSNTDDYFSCRKLNDPTRAFELYQTNRTIPFVVIITWLITVILTFCYAKRWLYSYSRRFRNASRLSSFEPQPHWSAEFDSLVWKFSTFFKRLDEAQFTKKTQYQSMKKKHKWRSVVMTSFGTLLYSMETKRP